MTKAEFTKLPQKCGCIFALKKSENENKIIWIFVSPNCDLGIHGVEYP